MFNISAEAYFDSAHFLAGYDGRCGNIHGHRWRVIAEIKGDKLTEEGQTRGMLIDFSDLKKDLFELVDSLDHHFVIEKGTLRPKTMEALAEEGFDVIELPFRPTAEEFARYFYDRMSERGHNMARVTVYETPANCAIYTGED
ncbi:6-pyruvoyl trahydropterin synthase family protein [Eubacterium xylanophilum]|uniref:6-pyruvoyl trahydropterin synthase family protein n=1 Tax=Eubacterium xylanophilum TaxID=39497 RepID=UPI00047B415A|nr:6-carboxytetrahydropterin synthase [Eubacterium xylanophilum]